MTGTKAFGLIVASLLSFQSSVGLCVCHSGETHPPAKFDRSLAASPADSNTDEHPCHSHQTHQNKAEPSHSSFNAEANEPTRGHDQDHGCCCIRKDESAVKSEIDTFCFQKGKFSSVALQAVSIGGISFGMPLLGKYGQAHAPPYEIPLYLSLKTLRI